MIVHETSRENKLKLIALENEASKDVSAEP